MSSNQIIEDILVIQEIRGFILKKTDVLQDNINLNAAQNRFNGEWTQAEFLPALMIPNEQRMASLPYISFSGCSSGDSSASRILLIAYC